MTDIDDLVQEGEAQHAEAVNAVRDKLEAILETEVENARLEYETDLTGRALIDAVLPTLSEDLESEFETFDVDGEVSLRIYIGPQDGDG